VVGFGHAHAQPVVQHPVHLEKKTDSGLDKSLLGVWKATFVEIDGVRQNSENDGTLTITPYKIIGRDKECAVELEASLTMDPAKTPKTIDIHVEKAKGELTQYIGKSSKAIYEENGDTLKACWTLFMSDRERPTEFSTKTNSGLLLAHYKKQSAVEKEKSSSSKPTK
jgi:uncharacterized protein (TIGR03067 family)